MFCKELVNEHAYRRLVRVRLELSVVPSVAEGRCTADRFAQLRPYWYRSSHAIGDLFALELSQRCDNREKEPTGRRTGVDSLLQRN